ncbi:uncharacterized protein VP01_2018g3 [Puccinia sorghi]|uniref:Uncharacterized protein n=1 Tax=Puccinia sorghi TaxID=27349 RepID=A0A0L6VD20_9BASI|nr:uncharacterized protein VP01_2018g3 [Puccinia sorghi]
MVFVSHAPATKVAVVHMSLQGHSLPPICNTLGYSVSHQSLYQWGHLFEQGLSVHNPNIGGQSLPFLEGNTGKFIGQQESTTSSIGNTQQPSQSAICLLVKYFLVERMRHVPEELIVFTGNKVPGSFCCYSNHSPKLIQPSFDAQSLCSMHSECAKKSTYAKIKFFFAVGHLPLLDHPENFPTLHGGIFPAIGFHGFLAHFLEHDIVKSRDCVMLIYLPLYFLTPTHAVSLVCVGLGLESLIEFY